jgi:hypothetical protein
MNESLRLRGGASPYNKRIEPTARGRHALCGLSVGATLWAKVTPVSSGPSASQAALRPCSRLIRAFSRPQAADGVRTGLTGAVAARRGIEGN